MIGSVGARQQLGEEEDKKGMEMLIRRCGLLLKFHVAV